MRGIQTIVSEIKVSIEPPSLFSVSCVESSTASSTSPITTMSATTTATATIVDASETASPFMLPGMTVPDTQLQIDAGGRVVRFDSECVLIPEGSKTKRPIVVTKSYSLPLWKRKGQQSDSDAEDSTRSSARSPSPEDTRVVIKLPIPTFRRRSSRSPTRGRSVSASPVVPSGLTPCLVHRDVSLSPTIPSRTLPRRPSMPIYQRRKDDITIPLRECCQACERITEDCLREGERWQEKFSRAARRRRSASLDHNDAVASTKLSTLHVRTSSFTQGSSALAVDGALSLEVGAKPSKLTLTVDEVDKRRKSLDLGKDQVVQDLIQGSSPSPEPAAQFEFHERDFSSSSTTSATPTIDDQIPDILDSRHRLRSSPIAEEDETQLFPLPRRSPSGTPSPTPSPNGSTVFLPATLSGLKTDGRSASARSSKENVMMKTTNSQESLLKASLSRKPLPSVGLGIPGGSHLPVPSSASSSRSVSPSSPLVPPASTTTPTTTRTTVRVSTHGMSVPTAPTAEERAALSPITPKGPRPSPVTRRPPLPLAKPEQNSSVSSTSSSDSSSSAETSLGRHSSTVTPISVISTATPVSTTTIVEPPASPTSLVSRHQKAASTPAPSSPTHGLHIHSPFHSQSHISTPSSPSSRSPGTPLSPGQPKRKHSFTAPFLKAGGVIRGVSVDVLKGVSSMGGSGVSGF